MTETDPDRTTESPNFSIFLHGMQGTVLWACIFGDTVPKNPSELLPIQLGNRRGERARESKNENRNRGRRGTTEIKITRFNTRATLPSPILLQMAIGRQTDWNSFPSILYYVSECRRRSNCPGWGSNSRPSDYETDALPTALPRRGVGKRQWRGSYLKVCMFFLLFSAWGHLFKLKM